MRFSPSTLGWYPEHIEYPSLPSDVIKVDGALYKSLLGKPVEAGANGMPREKAAVPATFDERKASMLAAIDAHLNAAAQAKGYDSILSASLRAALPASVFHAEGVAFGTWMDAVYAKCYDVLAKVQSKKIAEPTKEELIAMLPVLVLPS